MGTVLAQNAKELAEKIRAIMPGFALCLVIGLAAAFVSEHYGGPVILYALLMGMALNYLSSDGKCAAGIQFSAKTVLRFGIALLGARITVEQLLSLGLTPIVLVLVAVPATIGFGYLLGRKLGLKPANAILTGSSVGICGASAAIAVSAVLPQDKESEKNLLFTVVTVTALSTVAMILYPFIVSLFNFSPEASGVFLGATIHDVAQVVGAGYLISDEVGDIATFTKLLRVAMLVPVVLVIAIISARYLRGEFVEPKKGAVLPLFLVGFVLIVVLNSFGVIPKPVAGLIVETSRWCLVLAMVALGMKSSFKELAAVGWRPLALMVSETLFIAMLVSVSLWVIGY